jgi:tRNA uridine 5-carboxymethylaminomethyl modification enzyme
MEKLSRKVERVIQIKEILNELSIVPQEINEYLQHIDSSLIEEKQKASKLLLRPDVSLQNMMKAIPKLKEVLGDLDDETIEQAEIQIKYARYIEKEQEMAERISKLEDLVIPQNFDYNKMTAISTEAMQKFNRIRPRTLGQASRISGVNPSDVQILMVYMGR